MSENASRIENRQYKEVHVDEVPLSPMEHWFLGSTARQKDNPYKPEGIGTLSEQEIIEMNRKREEGYFRCKFLGSALGISPMASVAIKYGEIDIQKREITEKPRILGVIREDGSIDERDGAVLTEKYYEYYKRESPDYYNQLMNIGQYKPE